MSETRNELPTFVVPLQKSNILVPNATVAEIIPYEPLQRVQDTADWFLGFLAWRGVQVPVVSFEMLTVERASFSLVSVSSASLVVIRSPRITGDVQYIALVSQALPRLVRINPTELAASGEKVELTELMKVRYAGEIVAIPNLEYVESEVCRVAFQDGDKSPNLA
jgi:chemosensory pili system protein ChpC